MIEHVEIIADWFDIAGNWWDAHFVVGYQAFSFVRDLEGCEKQVAVVGDWDYFVEVEADCGYAGFVAFYLDLGAFALSVVR